METSKSFQVQKTPNMVETPNAIYEHCDAFSVVGANSGKSGAIIHIQFARDIACIPKDGALVNAQSIEITRRICATISIPAHAAEALAKAILDTIQSDGVSE